MILARADFALYEAKNTGRNRIYAHDGIQAKAVEPEVSAEIG
jgi:predicted signal transduction protein with EAL and GGDEF domain